MCLSGVRPRISSAPPAVPASPSLSRLSFDYEPVGVHSPAEHANANVTVSICLVVRNETIYLDEWVDFHISMGL